MRSTQLSVNPPLPEGAPQPPSGGGAVAFPA